MICAICKTTTLVDDPQLVLSGGIKTFHNKCLVDSLTYLAAGLNRIAYGYVELSQEKALLQRDHYIKIAKVTLDKIQLDCYTS